MRGVKELDGKRVRILRSAETKGGTRFAAGEEGTFHRRGAVACEFVTDDDRTIRVGHWNRCDFAIVDEAAAGGGAP
jgi:hypothetical protein